MGLCPGRQQQCAIVECSSAAQKDLVVGRADANRRIAGNQLYLNRFIIFARAQGNPVLINRAGKKIL
jgi:hypothetical protein